MSVAQIDKLKRLRQQAELDSTMESGCKAGRLLSGEIQTLLNVLEKSVVQLRAASRDEFFKKQPLMDRELVNLSAFIDTLAAGLENFKSKSIMINDLLEADNILLNGNTNGNGNENGYTNGNTNGSTNGTNGINGTNGSTNGNTNGTKGHVNGGTNGNTNGADLTGLVIDPFKWTPVFPKVPHGKPMACVVAHINDPSDFYLHPNSDSPSFVIELQREQNKLIKKGIVNLPEVKAEMYCCARYDVDTYWYRARIIDIIHANGNPEVIEKVKVFYLDYGNSAEVDLDELMPMAASIAQKPIQSVNCHLALYDPYNGWPEGATEEMKTKIDSSRVKVTFSEESPRISDLGSFPFYPVDLRLKDNTNVFECLRKFIAEATK